MLPPIGSTIKQISSSTSQSTNNQESSTTTQQQPNQGLYYSKESHQDYQNPILYTAPIPTTTSPGSSGSIANSISSYPSYPTGQSTSEPTGYQRSMVMQVPTPVGSMQQQTTSYVSQQQQQHYASLVPGTQPTQYGHAQLTAQQILPPGAPLHSMHNYHQLHHQQQQHNQALEMNHLQEAKRGRRFRRRYNQIVRKYACSYNGCTKSYGSLNHLNTHIVTKKHGHRKSKADFQHTQNSEEGHKSTNSYSESANNNQVYSQQQQAQQQAQAQVQPQAHSQPQQQVLQQSYPLGQNPSDYTSGNYWYGYSTHLRTSNSLTGSQSVDANNANPQGYQTAPQGYMYYQNYPQAQQISHQVSSQRYPVMSNPGLPIYNSLTPIYQQQPVTAGGGGGGEAVDGSAKSRKDLLDGKPAGAPGFQ